MSAWRLTTTPVPGESKCNGPLWAVPASISTASRPDFTTELCTTMLASPKVAQPFWPLRDPRVNDGFPKPVL